MSRAPGHPATPHAELRLWAARALAWALLFGGWFVLGALGHARSPSGAGLTGAWPQALWLLAIGALLTLTHRWPSSRARLALAMGAASSCAAFALWVGLGPASLALLALAWAALLVAASRAVRLLRQVQRGLPPAPVTPAIAGGALAWLLAGDLPGVAQHAAVIASALFVAAALLMLQVPARVSDAQGCRAGLFDCSLPVASLAQWSRIADWPLHAAALVMLPMMALLPTLAERCVAAGTSVSAMTAAHLAAMLLPAWGSRAVARGMSRQQLRSAVAALLAAGAALPWLWPAWSGLMAASLLHCAAWSLAWAVPMLQRDADPAPARRSALAAGVGSAVALLFLGMAVEQFGLVALQICLAGLALLAGVGVGAMLRTPAGAWWRAR